MDLGALRCHGVACRHCCGVFSQARVANWLGPVALLGGKVEAIAPLANMTAAVPPCKALSCGRVALRLVAMLEERSVESMSLSFSLGKCCPARFVSRYAGVLSDRREQTMMRLIAARASRYPGRARAEVGICAGGAPVY